MNPTALVVDADAYRRAATSRALTELGYSTLAAASFDDAQRYLAGARVIALLVADVRLGAFNGLHLAFRARSRHPGVRLIITDHGFDRTLESETLRLGGVYVAKPFTDEDLAMAVARLTDEDARESGARRWPRKPVVGAVMAAVGPRQAQVLDVSYGGLCLRFSRDDFDPSLPPSLPVQLTTLGLSFTMHPVWAREDASPPSWRCGGELVGEERPLTEWREFVDSYVAT
jgi:CheY-like chemotaxis protein